MEIGSRTRVLPLSVMEQWQLRNEFPEHLTGAARKIHNHFGRIKGTGLATSTLLSFIRGNREWQQGERIKVDHHFFPVYKHIFASAVKQLAEQPSVFRANAMRAITCECMPSTSLMPKGCQHAAAGFYLTAEMPFISTLCPTCSSCIRCGKILGYIKEWPGDSIVCLFIAGSPGSTDGSW